MRIIYKILETLLHRVRSPMSFGYLIVCIWTVSLWKLLQSSLSPLGSGGGCFLLELLNSINSETCVLSLKIISSLVIFYFSPFSFWNYYFGLSGMIYFYCFSYFFISLQKSHILYKFLIFSLPSPSFKSLGNHSFESFFFRSFVFYNKGLFSWM